MSQSLIVDTLRKCRNRPTSQSSILFVIVSIVNTCEAIYLQRYDLPLFFFMILPRFRKGQNLGNKRGQWGTRPPGSSADRKRASSLAVDFFDAIMGVDYFDADALFGSPGKSSASRYNLGAIGY